MFDIFSGSGISALDFTGISVPFILTMLLFFGVRDGKRLWLHKIAVLMLVLQSGLLILFRDGSGIKILAALMLMTTLIVEAVIDRRRNLTASKTGS